MPLISLFRPSLPCGRKEGGKKKKKKDPIKHGRRQSEKTCFPIFFPRSFQFRAPFSLSLFPAFRRRGGFVEDHSVVATEKTLMKGARRVSPTWRLAGPLATSGGGGGGGPLMCFLFPSFSSPPALLSVVRVGGLQTSDFRLRCSGCLRRCSPEKVHHLDLVPRLGAESCDPSAVVGLPFVMLLLADLIHWLRSHQGKRVNMMSRCTRISFLFFRVFRVFAQNET